MEPWFTATEVFGPQNGQSWERYVNFSGLRQLDELVSLDSLLCPPVLKELKEKYWSYIVNEDFMLKYFVDLDFLKKEISGMANINLLGVFRNPPIQPTSDAVPANFEFLGYDLCERDGGVSALCNCGGFPEAFSNDELSCKGLLASYSRAVEVQKRLRRSYPEEPHADCHLWAIFRFLQ
jgi:hypothetical protein